MKKVFILSICICFCAILNSGCKKNTPSPAAVPTVVGFWAGVIEAFPITNGFDMLINSDGTVKIYISTASSVDTTTATNTATGSYTFKDTTFTATTMAANGATIKFNGTYSKTDPSDPTAGPFLSGTWSQTSTGGSFGINKVN
jgi:hypothetical protein